MAVHDLGALAASRWQLIRLQKPRTILAYALEDASSTPCGGAPRRGGIGGDARGSISPRLSNDDSEKHTRRVTSKSSSVAVALYLVSPRA
jgi:hypothetical protein